MQNLNPKPIFIVGCPRSGSTVLSSILNKHPNIATSSETHFFNHLRNIDNFKEAIKTGFSKETINKLYDDTRFADFCNVAKITEEEFWHEIAGSFGTEVQLEEKDFFNAMASALLKKKNKTRFLEKTPQHLRFVEEILELYPEAKFINLIRDGRDCVNSLLKMPWRPSGVTNNARFWNYYIRLIEKLEHRVDKKNLISIRYEDLVKEPEQTLKTICSFIEEDFNEEMLTAQTDTSIFAEWESDWKAKANDELDPSRAGAWQEELSHDDAILLNTALKKSLIKLGYPVDESKYQADLSHHFELLMEYIRIAGRKLLRF